MATGHRQGFTKPKNVDVNEDSHPWTLRIRVFGYTTKMERRRQRGFAPLDAQNAVLVPIQESGASTSTRIRALATRCPVASRDVSGALLGA